MEVFVGNNYKFSRKINWLKKHSPPNSQAPGGSYRPSNPKRVRCEPQFFFVHLVCLAF